MKRLWTVLSGFFIMVCFFSCSGPQQVVYELPSGIVFDLPPKQEQPVLRILDYKNRNEGAALAPWLRSYLETGISGPESFPSYRNSYLFVASVNSEKQQVVRLWLERYLPDRDFSRLAAQRIQRRLERDLSKPPDAVYGSNYQNALKAAYGNNFWGSRQLDDTWVRGISVVENEDPENPGSEPEKPAYWGFILISIPKETLEIQISELLSGIINPGESRTASKEQNMAFDVVKGHFFDRF